jgi:hypothetical protein
MAKYVLNTFTNLQAVILLYANFSNIRELGILPKEYQLLSIGSHN